MTDRFLGLWRNKWLTSDARSLDEMIDALRSAANKLTEMRDAGIEPDTLYGDSDLLPENPGQAVALLDEDSIIVRAPGAMPVTLPADALDEALVIAQSGAESTAGGARALILYTGAAEWQRHSAQVEAVRAQFDGIKVQLLTGGPLALFAQQLPSGTAINLLQGQYAPRKDRGVGVRAWRVAAMLAISAIGWLPIVDDQAEWLWITDVSLGLVSFVLVFFRRRWPVTVAVLLSLFSAVFRVGGNFQRFAVGPQQATIAFVKPLGWGSDRTGSGAATLDSQAEHLHTVGKVFLFLRMHGLPIPGASQVGESGARDQAARRIGGLVDRRKQLPIRFTLVDRVVTDEFLWGALPHQVIQLHSASNRTVRQLINRRTRVQQAEIRFFDQSDPSHMTFLDLDESCH